MTTSKTLIYMERCNPDASAIQGTHCRGILAVGTVQTPEITWAITGRWPEAGLYAASLLRRPGAPALVLASEFHGSPFSILAIRMLPIGAFQHTIGLGAALFRVVASARHRVSPGLCLVEPEEL
jgi:hypothetical protein